MWALVAELVDAADSKSVVREDVGVRVSPRAPSKNSMMMSMFKFYSSSFFLYNVSFDDFPVFRFKDSMLSYVGTASPQLS